MTIHAVPHAAASDPLPRARPEEVGMSSARLGEIGKVLRADVERGRLPGAVLAVARKGRLACFEAFGFRDKAAGVPMTTDTIFGIASMTKPVAAVAGLIAAEQGLLTLDDPVAKYFPKFASPRVAVLDASGDNVVDTVPAARPILTRDLMMHTCGLIYGNRGTTAVHKLYPQSSRPSAQAMTGPEFLAKLSGLPLLHHPGSVWDYGFGLDVLGLIVEAISGQSLGQFLHERLFKPLGMADTSFVIPAAKAARYAKPLANDPDTGAPQSLPDLTQAFKFECGGGGLASTASDYLRFALMLLDKGRYGDARILGRKTVEYMVANQLGPEVANLIGKADPTRAGYGFGLGLAVRTTSGVARTLGSVGDFSWPGASGTNWWADPKEDLAVVFLAASPGTIRWHYRYLITTLVHQAIVD